MSPEELEKPEGENKEKPKSKVVCAWCGKEMGEIEGIEGGETSHGICPECMREQLENFRKGREGENKT